MWIPKLIISKGYQTHTIDLRVQYPVQKEISSDSKIMRATEIFDCSTLKSQEISPSPKDRVWG